MCLLGGVSHPIVANYRMKPSKVRYYHQRHGNQRTNIVAISEEGEGFNQKMQDKERDQQDPVDESVLDRIHESVLDW